VRCSNFGRRRRVHQEPPRREYPGSWCVVNPTRFENDGNDEEVLAVRPGRSASSIPRSIRCSRSWSVSSSASIPVALTSSDRPSRFGTWPRVLTPNRSRRGRPSCTSTSRQNAPPNARHVRSPTRRPSMRGCSRSSRGHLETADRVSDARPRRASPIPGVLETPLRPGPSGSGTPLTAWKASARSMSCSTSRAARPGRASRLGSPPRSPRRQRIRHRGPVLRLGCAHASGRMVSAGPGLVGALVIAGNAERLIVVPVEDSSIIYSLPVSSGVRPAHGWLRPGSCARSRVAQSGSR